VAADPLERRTSQVSFAPLIPAEAHQRAAVQLSLAKLPARKKSPAHEKTLRRMAISKIEEKKGLIALHRYP